MLVGALARVTRLPEFCAVVDAGDSFDPRSAAEAGVELAHLLWIRCGGNAENALKAADLIIQAGGFGIVALDLAGVSARDARRISLASWFRLRHAVEKTPTALVVVEEDLNAGTCSRLKVRCRPGFQMKGKLLQPQFQV
jgi:recombination protein RecA